MDMDYFDDELSAALSGDEPVSDNDVFDDGQAQARDFAHYLINNNVIPVVERDEIRYYILATSPHGLGPTHARDVTKNVREHPEFYKDRPPQKYARHFKIIGNTTGDIGTIGGENVRSEFTWADKGSLWNGKWAW